MTPTMMQVSLFGSKLAALGLLSLASWASAPLAMAADGALAPGAELSVPLGDGKDAQAFTDGGIYGCTTQNLRGARYDARAEGPYAQDRACDIALDECYRNTLIRSSCHVVSSGPIYQPLPPPPPPYDPRLCQYGLDTSDAVACGAPDGNGRQWFCSPRNNWCVLP